VLAWLIALRHSNVGCCEIYNEEHAGQWWDGDAASYRAVVERTAREVRSAAPGVSVLFGGMTFPDVDWVERVCADVVRIFEPVP
jgi:hypothetical protein